MREWLSMLNRLTCSGTDAGSQVSPHIPYSTASSQLLDTEDMLNDGGGWRRPMSAIVHSGTSRHFQFEVKGAVRRNNSLLNRSASIGYLPGPQGFGGDARFRGLYRPASNPSGVGKRVSLR